MHVLKLGAAVCVGAILVAASPVSAEPIERERYSFQESDTFTETECGDPMTIEYAGDFSGLFMLKSGRRGDPTPYVFDNYSGVETYTNVANGKTATVQHEGFYQDLRIEHLEGTVYEITAVESGRPFVVTGPDGTKLISDRGRIFVHFTVDTKGDADLGNDEFLSFDDPEVAGPHPIFFDEAGFCDLVELLR